MPLSRIRRWTLLALGATVLVACNEQQLQQGLVRDEVPPFVQIIKSAGDTLQLSDGIVFDVRATDNLGISDVSITLSGGHSQQLDTTLSTAVTDLTVNVNVPLGPNSTSGGLIFITASVTDGNNNTTVATDSLVVVNQQALTVRIVSPQAGAVTAPGLSIPIQIEATQRDGVRLVWWQATGVVTDTDSLPVTPAQDTVVYNDTLTVAGNTATGQFQILAFAEDSAGRVATSSVVTVAVQQTVTDVSPPQIVVTVPPRAETRDTIRITANDPSGVTNIAWTATVIASGLQVGANSVASGGTLTQVSGKWDMNLGITTFASLVQITTTATDAATPPNSGTRVDTITVVNGITKPLPAGGKVIDAIFNPNRNEFYLTNVALNRLEVFQLADTSYVAGGIRVGSEPRGIAMWPRDTLGNNADTVVVANSGGTNVSVVDVRNRRETRRHRLPNFLVQTVSTELNATGAIVIKFTEYDFSDRPQYLGMTCRTNGGTNCVADSVFTVYSTAPTPGQTEPFDGKSTVRWENLTSAQPHSHFFWEHAEVAPSPDHDSLRIFVDRGPNAPFDTVLSVAKGVMVDLDALAFQDLTFVRSSGNATHALVGEGGAIELARAVGYNGSRQLVRTVDVTTINTVGGPIMFSGPTERDRGITPGIRVRDEIANVASSVKSIGINFNGLTNIVRADSIYVLDENLRLAGLIPVGGANAGMDLNFQHRFDPFVGGTPGSFGGVADSSLRMVFLSSEQPVIEVYDTFYFGRVTSIPIRDPIIGPLRVARIPATQEQVLVGVTVRGVVMVRFPQIANTFPAQGKP